MAKAEPPVSGRRAVQVSVVGSPGVGKTTLSQAWAGLQHPGCHPQAQGTSASYVSSPGDEQLPDLLLHDLSCHANEAEVVASLSRADVIVLVFDFQRRRASLGFLQGLWLPRWRDDVRFLVVANRLPHSLGWDHVMPGGPLENSLFASLPPTGTRTWGCYDLSDVTLTAPTMRRNLVELALERDLDQAP